MRSRHYIVLTSVLFVCWFFLLLILNSSNPGINEKNKTAYRIEVIFKARANPPDFWRVVEQGVASAAEEFSIEYSVKGPKMEINIDEQIELVEKAISRKPDAIILAAGDQEKLIPVCKKIKENGIKLILLDSRVNYEGADTFVGTNNIELGKKLGKQLINQINPGDKYGVIGHVKASSTAVERLAGLMTEVENSGLVSAGTEYCNSIESQAKALAIEMIRNNDDIKCLVGLNETSALGISAALVELGLGGKIPLIACDSSEQQIQYMEQGTIASFVIQNPFNMGYIAVKETVNLLKGFKIKANYNIESKVITKSNLYAPENQHLLFPFFS